MPTPSPRGERSRSETRRPTPECTGKPAGVVPSGAPSWRATVISVATKQRQRGDEPDQKKPRGCLSGKAVVRLAPSAASAWTTRSSRVWPAADEAPPSQCANRGTATTQLDRRRALLGGRSRRAAGALHAPVSDGPPGTSTCSLAASASPGGARVRATASWTPPPRPERAWAVE
jgi:hypothetical protein